jgi:iron complex outermembrane receptor protein
MGLVKIEQDRWLGALVLILGSGSAFATFADPPGWSTAPAQQELILALEPQTQPAAGPSAARPETALQEVIVTARRREEDLQTVPISVSAFSADELLADNITSAQALSMFVPALVINNNAGSGSAFVLRGQGTVQGAQPGVLAYFAEAPMISAPTALGLVQGGLAAGQFYDLQSVEALEGPQGTLFGRNSVGGAVLINPQLPTDRQEGYSQMTVGAYDWREIEAAVNVPVVADKLLLRAACDVAAREGYTRDVGPYFAGRDYDNLNHHSLRLSALWRPVRQFENQLVVTGYYRDQNGQGGSLLAVNPNSLATAAYPSISDYLTEQQARGPRRTSLSAWQVDRELTYGFFDITRWTLNDQLTLRNIAAYQADKNTDGLFDSDYGPFVLQDVSSAHSWAGTGQQYSEEVQLSGLSLQGRLQWVGGAYFQYNKPTDTPEFDVTEPFPQANGSFASTTIVAQGGTTERSYAAYGQASYKLAGLSPILEGLKATAGYRYTWDLESAFSNVYIPQFGNVCALTSSSAPTCMLTSSALFQAPTWTLALEDQIGSHTFVYVTGRRGYKSGGFNLLTPLQSLYSTYQPEHVTDVEVGLKSDWNLLGMPVRSNVDAFHADYADIQRIVAVQANGITSAVVENAAAATIEGIELRSVARPANLIDVFLNYSYLNARYTRYMSPLSGDLSGLTFPFTARNKLSLGASYRLPLAPRLGELSVSANYSFQSSTNGGPDFAPSNEMAGYGLVNLRAEWNRVMASTFDVSLFVTNATDKVYEVKESGTYNAYGVTGAVYGEPRIIGAQLRYHWGTRP